MKLDPNDNSPIGVKMSLFHCIMCLKKNTSEEDAIAAAEAEYPCGTSNGWFLAKDRPDYIVQCADDPSRQHVLFVA